MPPQAQAKSVLPVVLLGCGGVGRHLLRHIVSCRPLHANQGVSIRVVGVSDSSSLLLAADDLRAGAGLDDALLGDLCAAKSAGSPLSSLLARGQCQLFNKPEAMSKVIDAATMLGRTTGLVLVDCSATYDTIGVLKDAVDQGCCVVLANKKPLTSSYVGAGLPVIASVTRIIASGDPISRIVGSLSGTLGYVMNPRDDLSGMDVARKALILARLLGRQISMEDINLDESIEERVKAASLRGNVLRYVGVIESTGCQVGLQEVPKDSALGRLMGSDNVVEIYSRCYENSPLVIQGAGAGNDTTAAGVLADIVDLQDLFQKRV
ncbi:hypothetical protein BRADI_4g43920v3 [Brachypodium distachyon]|uniref:homoserine dehydrogenase n=1 Tax=Brachypodium distachyon TaxID=15368 RepID=A0A2K2CU11_BRADI|nr:hypothetical protein BRADI_4g43920v3 [Brachypodium distachyon]